jgi:Tat protein translocase TatB subunit
MFDIGGPEFILLVLLGLLIFGPRRLPQIGKQFGAFVGQMRQAMREFQGTLEREVSLDELKRAAQQVRDLKQDAVSSVRDLTDYAAPLEGAPGRALPAPAPSAKAPEAGPESAAAPGSTPPDTTPAG